MKKKERILKTENTWWYLLAVVLLLMILPGANAFPYPGNGQPYSDYATTHYPYAVYLLESIKEFGEIPLWSNQIYSGMPFFANPQAGIWYPLYWIGYLFPLPFGFTVIIAVHLLLGLAGMRKFLKRIDLIGVPALIATAAFLLMPKLWAHFGAGHLTLFCGVIWLPWLLYLSLPAKRKWFWAWLQPGVVLALIFLVASQWVIYAGLVWVAWVLFYRHGHLLKKIVYMAGQGILALLLAMPLWLPMLEFVGYSSRQTLTLAERFYLSLPISNLVGLTLPTWNPGHEWVIYPGVAVLLLVVVTLLSRRSLKQILFWWLVVILAGSFALGDALPWNKLIMQTPGFTLLRVPTRSLFLAGFALAVLAGLGAKTLFDMEFKGGYTFRLLSVGLPVLVMLFGLFIMITGDAAVFEIVAFAVILLALIIWSLNRQRLSKLWSYGFLVIVAVEMIFSSTSMYQFKPVDEVFGEGRAAAEFISEDTSIFRVYSPSYSIPEHVAVQYGIELADGNDPIQIQQYVDFMEEASGVPVEKYAPTIPAFAGDDPKTANHDYLPDPALLGSINVKYIASAFPIDLPDLILHGVFDGVYVYENPFLKPRAYTVQASDVVEAEITCYSPNLIGIEAEGPGELILAQVNYPGWQVTINGEPAEITDLFMAVSLDAVSNTVQFRFDPPTCKYGILGGAAGLIILFCLTVLNWRTQRKESDVSP